MKQMSQAAVERAMKVQEVILRALSGRQSWLQVADVLGVSARTVRRLRWRYEHYGYDGLLDHRRRQPSRRAAPLAEVQRVLDEALPARFGGSTVDYQLVENEGPGGTARLRLVVHPSVPVKSVPELVAYAKSLRKPA